MDDDGGDVCEGSPGDRYQSQGRLRALPRFPVHVILDNLRSAFNVGSILRTSDATRVAQLHLCGITPHPPHRLIARTSLGAGRSVPWTHHADAADAIALVRQAGGLVVALEVTPSARSYLEVDYRFPLGLVLGHEVHGVSPSVLAQVDEIVTIPMWGVKNSINVATSFGILIYELRRRYPPTSSAAGRPCT
jgi:tRNA G18 (ribose-2'-O)-methylase SpoU